jgi:hypothetical protein
MSKKTSAETWKNRYDLASNRQERQFNKFQSWYDMKMGHVDAAMMAPWRSKVVLPAVANKIDSMIAKHQALNPGWEIGLYGDALLDEHAQDKQDKAQWKLEHDWDNPYFDEPMADKLYGPLVDAHVAGTGIGKIPWCFGDHKRFEKYVDPNTGELDITQDEVITSAHGYNDFIPHDIMSTFVAPGAKNLYGAAWIILEDYVTKEQLDEENEAAGGDLYDKKSLSSIEDMKATADRFAKQKQSREMLIDSDDPIAADTTINQFKRLECYERSGMIYTYVVGDTGGGTESFVELAARKNIYWHGKYPLVSFYVKKRPHSFWGESVYELTERIQAGRTDVFNHYMDSLNLSQDSMVLKQEGEQYTYIVEPGGEFLYQNDKPELWKFDAPDAGQFNTVMQFLDKEIEDATISSYAAGTPDSATDKTNGTASGIRSLQNAAGDKTGAQRKQFSTSLREIGRQWLSNNQQFMTQDFTLMGQVQNKPAPVTISPKDLQGQLILRVNDASMDPVTDEQKLMKFQALLQDLQAIQAISVQQAQLTGGQTKPILYDPMALIKDRLEVDGQANLDKIILDESELPPAQPPPEPDKDRVIPQFGELYGSEQAQVLQDEGITPDPQRTGAMHDQLANGGLNEATQQGVEQIGTQAPGGFGGTGESLPAPEDQPGMGVLQGVGAGGGGQLPQEGPLPQ